MEYKNDFRIFVQPSVCRCYKVINVLVENYLSLFKNKKRYKLCNNKKVNTIFKITAIMGISY